MAGGLESTITEYEAYGPLVASFLANLLATFGDKGQLVVITLATRYDAKRVFVGAVAAFGLWSALEVAFGSYATEALPPGAITAIAGGLFLVFGLLTLRNALAQYRATQLPWPLGPRIDTPEGRDAGPDGRTPDPDGETRSPDARTVGGSSVPGFAARYTARYGAYVTSFVFIMFAEFGDKTQALTIALASTFPDAPLSVFVGVVAALGLRTGVDALIGERIERYIPTRTVEVAAGIVFLSFGLAIFGVISETLLLVIVALTVLGLLANVLHRR